VITSAAISSLLKQYGISEKLSEYAIVQYFEQREKARLVVKAVLGNGFSLILKLTDDPDVTERVLEVHAAMTALYLDVGAKVPVRYRALDGIHHVRMALQGRTFLVTVEEFLNGTELDRVSSALMNELGGILGRMHAATERAGTRLGHGSGWSLFTGIEDDRVGQFDENLANFTDLVKTLENVPDGSINRCLVEGVKHIYREKRDRLHSVWDSLPAGAVHGDFAPNNMIVDDKGSLIGIVDFHVAGDEVYINDLMGEGVFLAYYIEHDGGEDEDTRDRYLRAFIGEYERYRPLSVLERSVANDLFSIYRPFRYQTVKAAERLASEGRYSELNEWLQEVKRLMECEWHI
jgi:Ser/Thr protein kinase RdoA (MazF antagonist)